MDYKLNLGAWNNVFAVPSAVVDDYIKLAGGNNLKVLLFVLRNAGQQISEEDVSKRTGVKPDDVRDALLFWEQTGLLTMRGDEITPGTIEREVPGAAQRQAPEHPAANIKKIELEREPRFFPKEIARAVRDDKGMSFLFKECERIFGRTLKHNEQNSLMVITEETGIPAECTLMLVEYCSSVGKLTPAYMKGIAVDWLVRGIMTIGAAETEIKVLKEANSLESRLKRLFEMNSAFSRAQKDLIKKWSTYGYDDVMLSEAYQITLDKTGKMAFPYMDKIIEKWHSEGIKTKEELEKSQKAHKGKAKRTEESGSSFDLDRISKLINER
jgi:DnaD/phage-associated family protein